MLEDGEFGHALSTQLCDELMSGRDWRILYSPSFLRSLLVSSLEASIHRDSVDSTSLHFTTKYEPSPKHPNGTWLALMYVATCVCMDLHV